MDTLKPIPKWSYVVTGAVLAVTVFLWSKWPDIVLSNDIVSPRPPTDAAAKAGKAEEIVVKTTIAEPPPTDTVIQRAGQYGDLFGGLTSLLSALTFAGVLLTIALQVQQLRGQSESLAQEKNDRKGERDARENAALEQHLFQMLQVLTGHTAGLVYPRKEIKAHPNLPAKDPIENPSGIFALRYYAQEILSSANMIAMKGNQTDEQWATVISQIDIDINDTYDTFVYVSPFMRCLFVLICHIEDQNAGNKKRMSELLESALSDEIVLFGLLYLFQESTAEQRKCYLNFINRIKFQPRDARGLFDRAKVELGRYKEWSKE